MSASRRLRSLAAVAILIAAAGLQANAAPGGRVISNTATASYSDGRSTTYEIVSNTVESTIADVTALFVTPKQTACAPASDSFPVGPPLIRVFAITNASNISDAYTIQAAHASSGQITGLAFVGPGGLTPIVIGSTTSQTVPPGGTVQVQMTLGTAGIALGTHVELSLTARTTAPGSVNGLQSDTGQQCALAAAGASFAGPNGALPRALNNGAPVVQARPGAALTCAIVFENYGGVAAQGVTLVDDLPAGIQPDRAGIKFNGLDATGAAKLNGQRVTVVVGSVPPGVVETVTFKATVSPSAGLGSVFVNLATLSALHLPGVQTTPASVLVGTGTVVFDGDTGASAPVGGVTLVLIDPSVPTRPVRLTGQPITPNALNANPFKTAGDGTYAFGLGASQMGPKSYALALSAPGYLNRRLSLALAPDPTHTLYRVEVSALDGQPLAAPGGFGLVTAPVTLNGVAGFFGNLPLFAVHRLQLSNTVDRPIASAGDRLIYTISYANGSSTPLGATELFDALPAGVVYAPGTARIDSLPQEPARRGGTLTWRFASFSGPHTLAFAAVVAPSAPANAILTDIVSIAAHLVAAPGVTVGESASAQTQVIAGAFSERTIITGRVYADVNGSGRFERGDTGVAAVRIYLEDGESVTTDPQGRFSFPAVRPGMHVLRLDPSTVPAGLQAYDDRRYDSERSTLRLVHGLFDGDLIQDVNFAVRPV